MNKVLSLTVMGVLLAVGMGVISHIAQAQSEPTTVLTFNINEGHSCPAGAQMCNVASPHQFNLERSGDVYFNYDVAQPTATSAHCSSIRVHTRVDGNLVYTTPWMGWPAYVMSGVSYPGDSQNRPLSTGLVKIGSFGTGDHTMTTQQEGTVGGCNFGYLLGGSGPVTVKAALSAKTEDKPECSDGKDNDGDGKIDMDDPGCKNPDDDDERDETKPQCSDNKDNDGDGLEDADDPGCHTDSDLTKQYNPDDDDERNGQCSDKKDNDGDKLIDRKDPDCHTDNNPNNDDSFDGDRDEDTDNRVKAAVVKVSPATPVAVTAKTGAGSAMMILTLAGAAGLGITRRFLA